MRKLAGAVVVLWAVGCGPEVLTGRQACDLMVPALCAKYQQCQPGALVTTLCPTISAAACCSGARCTNNVPDAAAVHACVDTLHAMTCATLAIPSYPCIHAVNP